MEGLGRQTESVPDHAIELIRLNVDVIVAVDNVSIAAAPNATKTIPIVMVLPTDPVGSGFVPSLARPGGNPTGLTNRATELQGKTLQLLKEAIPSVSTVAVLWSPAEQARRATAREAEMAARVLGLHAELVGASSLTELERVFTTLGRDRPDAVLVQPSHTNFLHRAHIAELVIKHLLPTMGWSGETVPANDRPTDWDAHPRRSRDRRRSNTALCAAARARMDGWWTVTVPGRTPEVCLDPATVLMSR